MKEIQTESLYVLVDKDGNMIGVDLSSGGYPYVPDNLTGVRFFSNRKYAESYQKSFPEYKVKTFHYTAKDYLS